MNKSRRDFLKGTAWMGAAAMAAGSSGCDVHAVDVASLQRRLAGFGAYLPNARI